MKLRRLDAGVPGLIRVRFMRMGGVPAEVSAAAPKFVESCRITNGILRTYRGNARRKHQALVGYESQVVTSFLGIYKDTCGYPEITDIRSQGFPGQEFVFGDHRLHLYIDGCVFHHMDVNSFAWGPYIKGRQYRIRGLGG